MATITKQKVHPAKPAKVIPAKTIPATPERTETVTVCVCDVCGKEQGRCYKCPKCDGDMCERCSVIAGYSGDYPDRWCKHCYALHQGTYKALYDKAEEDYDDRCEEIYEQMKAASLAMKTAQPTGGD